MGLGKHVTRWRWAILAAWLVLCALMLWLIPPADPTANERTSFLPEGSPYREAMESLAEHFPHQGGLSQATILFERPSGKLTHEDRAFIEYIAGEVLDPSHSDIRAEDLAGCTVASPGDLDKYLVMPKTGSAIRQGIEALGNLPGLGRTPPETQPAPSAREELPRNPMRSETDENGQAALVRVNIPVDFITYRSTQIIKHIRHLLQQASSPEGLAVELPPRADAQASVLRVHRPDGLRVAVSGSGGYGYDYARFVSASHDRTMIATLLAVIVILLVVYRAPIAAMIPLVAISLAAVCVIKLMNVVQNAGMAIGMAERIFVFVLMYGAGIDYSLLLISRYREFLATGGHDHHAAADALDATFPAISASAATDAIGICMLVFCQFLIFRTTGPVVAGSLVVAWLAAVTLVPALTSIFGRHMFWPVRPHAFQDGVAGKIWQLRLWPAIARGVTRRPGWVLVVTLALLAYPAARSFEIRWVYDALTGIDAEYLNDADETVPPDKGVGNAAAGIDIGKRHWPIGEIAPVTVLVKSDTPQTPTHWRAVTQQISTELNRRKGDVVSAMRTLNEPLGTGNSFAEGSLMERLARGVAQVEYISPDRKIMRMEILLNVHGMSNEAMAFADDVRGMVSKAAAEADLKSPTVHLAGATAQMQEIRETTQRDFRMVVILVLGVILVIVFVLLRDPLLTTFMVAAIGVSYLATLGICMWLFAAVFGDTSMDWKVQIFLFVVMAAVGVDYNIFLAARLAQEAKKHPPREAVCQAVAHTGPVISSCGLIMAATLASLAVGSVQLLQQLGLALGMGMLVDTFIVRPLLLPSFAALFKRTGKTTRLIT